MYAKFFCLRQVLLMFMLTFTHRYRVTVHLMLMTCIYLLFEYYRVFLSV